MVVARSPRAARAGQFLGHLVPALCPGMPSLDALARRLGDRAAILAVSVDENWEAIRKFFPKGRR